METKKVKAEIDLKELLFVVIRKLWIIILTALLFGLGAGLLSNYVLTPVYTSSAKVYVISRQEEDKMTYNDIQTGTQLTKDYMILVKSRPVMEEVIGKLELDMKNEQLAKMIDVNTPNDTRILEIIVTHPDANMSKLLADTIAEVSSERMVSVMEMKKVNVVEPGNVPTTPSSPDIIKNGILGAFIGGVLASLIIILVYIFNDTIRNSDDIEKYLGITTLGFIPLEDEHQSKKQSKKHNNNVAALAV